MCSFPYLAGSRILESLSDWIDYVSERLGVFMSYQDAFIKYS